MHEYLPYLTTFLTALIAVGGFVFSILRYIDLRNREEKRLNYENFNQILANLHGKILENGKITIEISFLIGKLYELVEFPQYKNISLPVLNYMKNVPIRTDSKSLAHIEKAIDEVIDKLSN